VKDVPQAVVIMRVSERLIFTTLPRLYQVMKSRGLCVKGFRTIFADVIILQMSTDQAPALLDEFKCVASGCPIRVDMHSHRRRINTRYKYVRNWCQHLLQTVCRVPVLLLLARTWVRDPYAYWWIHHCLLAVLPTASLVTCGTT